MLLNVSDYCKKYGISRATVDSAIRRGQIKVIKKINGRSMIRDIPYEFKHKMHGLSKDPAYSIWSGMKSRCENESFPAYKYYGARGIKICDEWQDPETFIKWAYEHGYKKGLSIDRIDSDKGYEPSNCRILTVRENSILATKKKQEKILEFYLSNSWCVPKTKYMGAWKEFFGNTGYRDFVEHGVLYNDLKLYAHGHGYSPDEYRNELEFIETPSCEYIKEYSNYRSGRPYRIISPKAD